MVGTARPHIAAFAGHRECDGTGVEGVEVGEVGHVGRKDALFADDERRVCHKQLCPVGPDRDRLGRPRGPSVVVVAIVVFTVCVVKHAMVVAARREDEGE